nr:glycosyltransferase N-terminal domain-containing protein [bacterium]
MVLFWKIVYNFILVQIGRIFYYEQILFNPKVLKAYNYRKTAFLDIEKIKSDLYKSVKILLIHSSSVGEFEQAKPIIELIKKNNPNISIVCSFFSPSGYDFGKKYELADGIILLPVDTRRRMRKFINLLKPELIFFMRYDLWPNLIWQSVKFNSKIFILNGTIRETSLRCDNRYGFILSFFRSFYRYIEKVFVISNEDKERYSNIIDPEKIIVAGDSRYDIVYSKSQNADFGEPVFQAFETNKEYKIFAAGSTYIDEDKILIPALKKLKEKINKFKSIIVPHEIDAKRIADLEKLCADNGLSFCKESEIKDKSDYYNSDVIIYDRMGVLYKIYKISDISFVGGSFHGSIHNIMEPAVYKKLIVFGPTHRNSYEALYFLKNNAA